MSSGKILLLGASGYIGRQFFAALGPEQAIATYCQSRLEGGVPFDVRQADVSELLDRNPGITHAVLLLAETDLKVCLQQPQDSEAVNVTGIGRVIDVLHQRGILPIFTSTDLVFDGIRGNYSEEDAPNPIIAYGRHKLAVERYLQMSGGPYLILRLSKVCGFERAERNLLTQWLDAIRSGTLEFPCATDERFSPILADDVIRAVRIAIQQGLSGLYHVAGREALSRYELMELLVRQLPVATRARIRIRPCSIRDFSFAEPRPLDTSLRPDRFLAASGLDFSPMRDVCAEVVRRHGNGL